MLALPAVAAVIFDLDGTIAHSNPDFSGLRAELGIDPRVDILAHLASLSAAQRQWATEIVHKYELQSSDKATWISGAAEVIAWWQSQGVPMAILTRNIRAAADLTVARLGLTLPLLTRDDVAAKPDPEGVWYFCQQWQVAPEQVLFIGDYLFDIQTARNAGCAVALYCPDELPEYAAQADWVFTSYQQLLAWLRAR
ncbi:HAD family hydrolase [Shewanella sp. NIFS-20-20]|uniref:HAD family hydrolase n=1 Tax=Shewanella sp. NIFS-20-20 TaxID=2853806 RepID=UPI001C465A1D|nr:HAD family hydrolase [Shewanella sp. NIFS-20-20]MBV7315266.1 HAD family hydrolase [Shewanella sp. NIFS-20-20]